MSAPEDTRPTSAPSAVDRWVELGYVARAHGIQGALRLKLYNGDSELWDGLEQLTLESPATGVTKTCKISSIRPGGSEALVVLEGCSDRTAAEALVGTRVKVRRSALPALEEGEYYHFDLIGIRAIDDRTGQEVGQISEVFALPTHDVYSIRDAKGRDILVPAVEAHVAALDLPNRVLHVRDISDLIDED